MREKGINCFVNSSLFKDLIEISVIDQDYIGYNADLSDIIYTFAESKVDIDSAKMYNTMIYNIKTQRIIFCDYALQKILKP